LDGLRRDPEGSGRLLQRETGEHAVLDDATGAIVELGETLEREIDGEHFFGFRFVQQRRILADLEADGAVVAASFEACPGPRVIDQDASHHVSGDGEQTVTVRCVQVVLPEQAQVGLVDQGRG
jgi:hypothetical protein